jgi:putative transcriptional regulator
LLTNFRVIFYVRKIFAWRKLLSAPLTRYSNGVFYDYRRRNRILPKEGCPTSIRDRKRRAYRLFVGDGQRSREKLESKAMSKAFEEISAGLDEAIKHAKGETGRVVVHEPETIDVKAIRAKTGMSQQRFCATFGISLGTLRHWEQGLRSPRGPARVLLKVIDNDPEAVIRAIDQ